MIDVLVVVGRFSRAGDRVRYRNRVRIRNDAPPESHGADEADLGAGRFSHGAVGCEQDLFDAEVPGEADFVDLVVSANDRQHHLLAGDVEERLQCVGCRGFTAKKGHHLIDRARIGRFDLFERGRLARDGRGWLGTACLGDLDVGGVVTGAASDDPVFPGLCEHLELRAQLAADRSAVGLDDPIVEAESLEDAVIGRPHVRVAF